MNIMKELIVNSYFIDSAIITALIAFIAGIIIACINAYINIKTNKAKIKSEEKRANLPYLDVIIKEIKGAIIELNSHEVYHQKNISKLREKIIESNADSLQILERLSPYLRKKDREELMNRYNEIIKNNDIIFDNYYDKKNKEIGNNDIELVRSNIEKEIHLKHDFKKVLIKELADIMDELRKNTGV